MFQKGANLAAMLAVSRYNDPVCMHACMQPHTCTQPLALCCTEPVRYHIGTTVCLFVCSFMIWAKTAAQDFTKLSGIRSVLHGLKLHARLAVLEMISFYFRFLFTVDGRFINCCYLDFRLLDSLIHYRSTIEFRVGCR